MVANLQVEVKKGFGYDKKNTFSNVIKHRDGIKQFHGKSEFLLATQ